MSDTYTKLFRSITASTIVSEPLATRWLWVTMLSQADSAGCVWGSVPGIARLANITLAECELALACFYAPDPYSRTQDHEGRRIEAIDGGWRLLNHAKYGAIRNEAERAEYKRQWDREHRPSGHSRTKQSDNSPTVRQQSDNSPTKPDSPTPPTPTPAVQDQELSAHPSAARFEDWWGVYPKKVGKKPARAKWITHKLDRIADTLIADVRNRVANDDGWKRGFAPDPTTYINQERWNDALREAPKERQAGRPEQAGGTAPAAAEVLAKHRPKAVASPERAGEALAEAAGLLGLGRLS